jgi:hypothetical protein
MQSNKTTIIITTAILILTLLSAGCTDTGGANPETTTYTTPPEESPVVEETMAAEPVIEPVETNWWDDDPEFNPAVINAEDNLFGVDIEGIKYNENANWYAMYDTNENVFFKQAEYTPSNLRLDLELSSDQYRTLIDQYGSMISVTMETIDLDQDGAMDKVAVKYVGSESVWEFERPYKDGSPVANYIYLELKGR